MTEVDEVVLTHLLVLKNGEKKVKAVCKYADSTKSQIMVIATDITESLVLHNLLPQKDQSFSVLGNIPKDIVFRYDFNEDTVTFSGGLLYRLVGVTAKKYEFGDLITGKTVLSFDAAQIKQIAKAMKNGEAGNFILIARDKRRNKVWLSIDYFFIRQHDCTYTSAAGVITDISEQIAAQDCYDKAVALWPKRQDGSVATIAINVCSGRVISGCGKAFPNSNYEELDVKRYSSMVAERIINDKIRKDVSTALMPKNLIRSFNEGKSYFEYEIELNINNLHNWCHLEVSLVQNPKTRDLIALLKWTDINKAILQQRINKMLFYKTYDYICCIFAGTDSYNMVSYTDKGSEIPQSVVGEYEETVNRIIEKCAVPEDKEKLKRSFSLKNLVLQLSSAQTYSFVGCGHYSDGSPAVKINSFMYLDLDKQIILYTRKDITNSDEILTIKCNNSVFRILLEDIIYVESFGKKSMIVTVSGKYEVNEMISKIQERLPGCEFIRCHRCYIARCDAIKKINRYTATMSNDIDISISRNYVDILRKRIGIPEK